jgi:hypothetical protein
VKPHEKANATRKVLCLNLTAKEARTLSPQMKQLIKAFAAMGITYHSSSEGDWVVVNGAGSESQAITVFTTGDEYLDFNFDRDGNFKYQFVGTTNDGDNEEIRPSDEAKT